VLIAIHLAALVLLTLAMRVGIHHILLHEALDVTIGAPRVCAHCTHLVPTMAFCPQCGVADRAVSRRHRPTAQPPPAPPTDVETQPGAVT
jgi:rRNA maturation endonuclease Nob1